MQKPFQQYPLVNGSVRKVVLFKSVAPQECSSPRSSTTAPEGGFEAPR